MTNIKGALENEEPFPFVIIKPYQNNFALSLQNHLKYTNILHKHDRKPVQQVAYFLNTNNQLVYLTGGVIDKALGLIKSYSEINLLSIGCQEEDTNNLFRKLEWFIGQNNELLLGEAGDKRRFRIRNRGDLIDRNTLYFQAFPTFWKFASNKINLNLLTPDEFLEMSGEKETLKSRITNFDQD